MSVPNTQLRLPLPAVTLLGQEVAWLQEETQEVPCLVPSGLHSWTDALRKMIWTLVFQTQEQIPALPLNLPGHVHSPSLSSLICKMEQNHE